MQNTEKHRAPRNRTLVLTEKERADLSLQLRSDDKREQIVVFGDFSENLACLKEQTVDLLILDPPYNINKSFNGLKFAKTSVDEYAAWLDSVVTQLTPKLKPTATVYICADWHTSHSVFQVAQKHFKIRNRITWEREKGRGATSNWKNSSEDIWFCTVSDDYYFDVLGVKLRRKVVAPYKVDGIPKDWQETESGNFRDTHPSNFWNDITIPFWSMPENTDHPTQKSEKLIAKLVIASSKPDDLILDPFLGSGTTAVVAKKLERRCIGYEINEEYCLWSLKRLNLADADKSIQGYSEGIFWERNSLAEQAKSVATRPKRKISTSASQEAAKKTQDFFE